MSNAVEKFELIITVVSRGFASDVMEAAKSKGATGGTIIHARGAGIHEAEKFFGVAIQPEKEVVLTLVNKEQRQEIMKEICKKAGLNTEGKGIVFSLPVDDVMGITRLDKVLQSEEE